MAATNQPYAVDFSWKGCQEFPDFTVTCPRCSSVESDSQKNEKSKTSFCRWNSSSITSVTSLDISHNLIHRIDPSRFMGLANLKELNLSSNRLRQLPEEICFLTNLSELYATNNALGTLPKNVKYLKKLVHLNLSGNAFNDIPPSSLEIYSLKILQLGGNNIKEVPASITNLQSLEVLYLGGNHIQNIPAEVGEMKSLSSLTLCDNKLSSIPTELVKLRNLQSLSLHNNRLTYLPREILQLVNLVELSLRGNPMVMRFVQELSCDPPSLVELASRTIKAFKLDYIDLPKTLVNHLNSAKKCPNPQCSGVYFNQKYHQIKFVDFCGKYRLPLMQYLCSPECISYSSCSSTASSETESEEELENGERMRRVLLG
ncbi:uncharacterized protein LOC120344261 [Styela clava]